MFAAHVCLLAAAVSQSPAEVPDSLALVQLDHYESHGPPFLTLRAFDADSGDFALPHATYKTFFDVAGDALLRHVFAADFDGDGVDELVAVRELVAQQRLALAVLAQPKQFGAKPKSIASFDPQSLPPSSGDGAAVRFGRIDFEGDGRDEVAWVRQYLDGRQEIEIVGAPQGKNDEASPPLAVVTNAGTTTTDETFGAFGVAIQGVRYLARFARDSAALHRIELHTMPAAGVAPLGAPLATLPVETYLPYSFGAIAPVARIETGGPGILFLRDVGNQHVVDVHPLRLDSTFAAPVVSEWFPKTWAPPAFAVAVRPRLPSADDPPVKATFELNAIVYISKGDQTLVFEMPLATAKATLKPEGWKLKLPGASGSKLTLTPASGVVAPAQFEFKETLDFLKGKWRASISTPGTMTWTALPDASESFTIGGFAGNVGTLTNLATGKVEIVKHFVIRRRL